jgi:SAM-dependent methyltransferase
MNYGYSPIDATESLPELLPEDEPHRNWIQLYHQVASRIELEGKQLVEVGSGRGGGCSYVHRYLKPAETTGIDISQACVAHCRQYHQVSGLNFIEGDAVNLPLDDNSVDVVLNVESSHAYPSREKFFHQACRILRPEGYFLFTDLIEASEHKRVESLLVEAGFKILEKQEISGEVLKALSENEGQKKELLNNIVSPALAGMFHEFAGYEGSTIVECLRSGYVVYYRYVMQKVG